MSGHVGWQRLVRCFAAGLCALLLLAGCQGLNGKRSAGDADGDADTDVDADLDTDVDVDVDVDADGDVDADADGDSDVDSDADTDVDGDADADVDLDTDADTDADTDTDPGGACVTDDDCWEQTLWEPMCDLGSWSCSDAKQCEFVCEDEIRGCAGPHDCYAEWGDWLCSDMYTFECREGECWMRHDRNVCFVEAWPDGYCDDGEFCFPDALEASCGRCRPHGACDSAADCPVQFPETPGCGEPGEHMFWSCTAGMCELECRPTCAGYGGLDCPDDESVCHELVGAGGCGISDAPGICLYAGEPTCRDTADCAQRLGIPYDWAGPPLGPMDVACLEGACVVECRHRCGGGPGAPFEDCRAGWRCMYPDESRACVLDDAPGICVQDGQPLCTDASDCGVFSPCPGEGAWLCDEGTCAWGTPP